MDKVPEPLLVVGLFIVFPFIAAGNALVQVWVWYTFWEFVGRYWWLLAGLFLYILSRPTPDLSPPHAPGAWHWDKAKLRYTNE